MEVDSVVGPADEGMRGPESVERLLSPVTRVSVGSLRALDSPRAEGLRPEHVRVLFESEAPLPPIVVHRPTMRVVDGAHRLHAARLAGAHDIEVRFFEGSERDAFVLAVRANTTHGLPLTFAERQSAAARILVTHPEWSDRAIASAAGLSARSVAGLRARSTGHGPQSNARIGRDGRVRPLDPAAGRLRVCRLIREHPDASLRELARMANMSVSTVRDVRLRVERGEHPVPPRARGRRERSADGVRTPQRRLVDRRDALLHELSRDPSLRFREGGRVLINKLLGQALTTVERDLVVEAVPSHRVALVVDLARAAAAMWLDFAMEVERRNHPDEVRSATRRNP
ncbi:ParB N-terminal domain-containing protein [Actinosynnema sp. CA-299493]